MDTAGKNKDSKDKGDHDDILEQDRRTTLFSAILQCKTVEECRAFITDLCTPQEIDTLSERWVIARLLDKGAMSYRDISAATGASTTTVGRVARFLQQEPHHGYRLVLDRIEKDEHNDKPPPDKNSAS